MKYTVFNGDSAVCSMGDVVFATFERGSEFANLMDYDHVAVCCSNRAIEIKSVEQPLPVYEAVDVPRHSIWPTDYEIHFLCKMYKNGAPLSSGVRAAIVDTAERIVRHSRDLINLHRGKKTEYCGWSLRRYKYVRQNPNNPDVIDELHFTCAGLVEYCYEAVGHDIVNDPVCTKDHKRLAEKCAQSTVPLVGHPHERREFIHRLFPGYQCKAFTDDTYPLDLGEMASKGGPPATFERCR